LIRKPWDDLNFRKMIRDLLDHRPTAGLADDQIEPWAPPERTVRHLDCEGQRSAEILAQVSETLDGPQGTPSRVVFVLDNLMKISGPISVFLSGIIGRIINRGARAALVDGSGTAGTFFEVVGGRLPVVVFRSESEMGPSKRVLVVEGKSDYLEYLRTLIESAGHECEAVASVGDAIGRLSVRSFDLVLLDLVLPDAEGLEVARFILERQLSTPVVAISGALDRPAAASPEEGIRRGLSVPFSPREILDAIRDS
jgi:CheY-like chemotaxis protein